MNALTELEKALKELVALRETHKVETAKLEAQKNTYAQEYLEKKKKNLVSEYKAQLQARYERTGNLLRNLEKDIQEIGDRPVNLESSELSTALKIIELAGSELDYESMKKINNSFQGKQGELKVLKAVYDNTGLTGAGIEKMLIPSELNLEVLHNMNYQVHISNGFVNEFAREINKVAQLAGEQFSTDIDNQGFEASLRMGAGLPEE